MRPEASSRGCEEARGQRVDDLHLVEEVWIDRCDRRPAHEADRARECSVEEASRGAGPRDRGNEGDPTKNVVRARVRRQQVAYAVGRGLSQRRACILLSVARSALNYTSRLREKDAMVLRVMRRLSGLYPRWGYRRIQVLLEREGFEMSLDLAYRLWQQAGLQVPKKRRRRRTAPSRLRPLLAAAPNDVWAYDFVFDRCANGAQLKCLAVVDEYTREPRHRNGVHRSREALAEWPR